MKLRRSIDTYIGCDPTAMSRMSEAAVYFALDDARSDILTLSEEVATLQANLNLAGDLLTERRSEIASRDELIAAILGATFEDEGRERDIKDCLPPALVNRALRLEYAECSGDPSSCPENEGYGCCTGGLGE